MFVVATDFLETVTGTELETLLADRFWQPLGMTSTSFSMPPLDEANLARGYHWKSEDTKSQGRYVPEPYIDLIPISGAGATISTVKDYSLWIKALLDAADGRANASSPITPALFHDLVTPRSIVNDPSFSGIGNKLEYMTGPLYALGWVTLNVGGETVVTHGGSVTGFGTGVYLLPAHRFGVVMMANTEGTSNDIEGILASVLLKRKVAQTGRSELATSNRISEALRLENKITLPPSKKGALMGERTGGQPHVANLPLPGSVEDFAGVYTHPAYGILNFTVKSAGSGEYLQAYLAPRTWPKKLELRHSTDTVFGLQMTTPHGLGKIDSDDIVWETVSNDTRAIFKFGLDGETVETMGIELEPSMIKISRSKGDKAWKDGMIWFERQW